MTCEDDDKTYDMQPIDCDLSFKVEGNTSWCTFETIYFGSYCLYRKHKQPTQKNRISAFYLKPVNFQFLDHFTVEVSFSFPISYCKRRNEALYEKKSMELDSSHNFEASCSVDERNASYFVLSYKHNIEGWHVDHSRSTEILTKDMNIYFDFTNVEDLLTFEESRRFITLFPPRYIINVTKKPNCNTDLNTKIIVTFYNKAKSTSTDHASFNLFASTMPISSSGISKDTVNFHQLMRCLQTLNDTIVIEL